MCVREKKKDIPGHTFLPLRILFCIAASHQSHPRNKSVGIATKTWTRIYRYIRKSITFLPFFFVYKPIPVTSSSFTSSLHDVPPFWRCVYLRQMFLAAAGPHLLNMCIVSVELCFTSCARRDVDHEHTDWKDTCTHSAFFCMFSVTVLVSSLQRRRQKAV